VSASYSIGFLESEPTHQLAQAHKMSSAGFADANTTSTGAAGIMQIDVGSNSFTVDIDGSNDTLNGVRDAINNAAGNDNLVTASIINVDDGVGGTESRLILTSNNTGTTNAITLSDNSGNVASTLAATTKDAAQDAVFTVDGFTVTRSSNVIDDVIQGVTFTLKAKSATAQTLDVAYDTEKVKESVQGFVDAYNEAASYIYQQQSYDEEEQEAGGILFGDGTLSSVKSDLVSTLLQTVGGVSSAFSTLGLVGIQQESFVTGQTYKGQLTIDTDTLRGYLESNFNDVKNLFAAYGTTTGGGLEYVSYTRDTLAGEYTVHITQAATQSTSTSDNGTVGADETLTITEGDKVAEIQLTAGMTLANIKNAINSELSNVYSETLVGDQQLYEGSGGSTALSSATTWDQVYLDASNSANLADSDVIAFTGTSRSGGAVEGSYTINDASEDTIQGLLSAIESAYGNEITASIDSAGKIVLTDKTSGSSQLSIAFDYTDAHNLTFGTSVSSSNTGGQEGRYAMDMTATDDGNGHLVLTHNDFGSDRSFTISEDTDSGLWTGSQTTPVTVNNGVDVAGTINGEAATGSGQTLTGDDGETNVDGLVVKYSGTDEDVDAGTVTLTLGVAELFERALFHITDSYEGYVAFKQDSLEDRIDDFETQIEQMEARLDRKMERMINQFVAMEVTLSQLQSQSEWLTGQINASYSGWW